MKYKLLLLLIGVMPTLSYADQPPDSVDAIIGLLKDRKTPEAQKLRKQHAQEFAATCKTSPKGKECGQVQTVDYYIKECVKFAAMEKSSVIMKSCLNNIRTIPKLKSMVAGNKSVEHCRCIRQSFLFDVAKDQVGAAEAKMSSFSLWDFYEKAVKTGLPPAEINKEVRDYLTMLPDDGGESGPHGCDDIYLFTFVDKSRL